MKLADLRRCALLASLLMSPLAASAHGGHAEPGALAGLLHPLTGLDHLLAIVAVGWWNATAQPRRSWCVPLAFAISMLAGALAGIARAPSSLTEPAIALSLLLFGALLARRVRLTLPIAIALMLPFGAMHGFAHGNEAPTGDSLPWLLGMVAATLALNLTGALAGIRTRRLRWATPLAGGVGIAAGIGFAYALLSA
jgi:urease accessory protein